jgi:rubrerythrin
MSGTRKGWLMIQFEALKLALSKEQDAVVAYKRLLAEHPGLKDLFYFLLNEEEKHVSMIEKKIAELYK